MLQSLGKSWNNLAVATTVESALATAPITSQSPSPFVPSSPVADLIRDDCPSCAKGELEFTEVVCCSLSPFSQNLWAQVVFALGRLLRSGTWFGLREVDFLPVSVPLKVVWVLY